MSCNHEWDEPDSNDTYCIICGKNKNEVRLEQQLAAANARVAELHKINEATVKRVVAEVDALNERAEAAEAQCDEMEVINTDLCADNKRMREALGKIINVTSKCLSHEEMKDKMKNLAKAALEEKP